MTDRVRREMSGSLGMRIGVAITGVAVLSALLAPLLAGDPGLQGDLLTERLLPPSGDHLLGTDQFGRDVWSRLLHGGRISLAIGFSAALVSAVLGTAVGGIAGYVGGWVDRILMRGVDLVLAFPRLVLLIAVVALFRPGLGVIALVIGLTQWPTTARLVRAEVLSLRSRDWVTAARVVGHPESWILTRHILPNALPPVLVVTALGVGYAILLEAGLSFLGLGVQPPTASWGGMIADGRDYMLDAWWLATFPGLAVVAVVVGLNLIGDGLRDRLDPRAVVRPGSRAGERAETAARRATGSAEGSALGTASLTVRAVDLIVRYPGGAAPALDRVTLGVAPGERVGIVGPSGSGKSTLALAIGGLLADAAEVSGELGLFGSAIGAASNSELRRLRMERVAWVFQHPHAALNPVRTVESHFDEIFAERGVPPGDRRARAMALLDEAGLERPAELLHAAPHQLSGGMAQRVAIALALTGNPELVIADEATSALDTRTQRGIADLLLRLSEERGAALLFVSHDLALVRELCPRIVLLENGRVIADLPRASVREDSPDPRVARTAAAAARFALRAGEAR